jgi:CheY-like chemotaxis protein
LSSSEVQPVVLIVEDRPASLKIRQELFESFGCTAIGAVSGDDALFELSSAPSVDLIVTDIHMGPLDRADRSGIELARLVRENWEALPIVGYSAYFAEGDLTEAERRLFDLAFAKGSHRATDLLQQVEACVALAQQHRERRERDVGTHHLSGGDASYVIVAPPTAVLGDMGVSDDPCITLEAQLIQAHYSLQIIPPDSGVPTEPFSVWLSSRTGGWVSEIYGYPILHAAGLTPGEAIEALVEVLRLFRAHLPSPEPSSPEIERLYVFLHRIFGSA